MAAAAQDRGHRGIARLLPVAGWLPRYQRRWLRGDVTAGIAVTALVVPKNLGADGVVDHIHGNVHRAVQAQTAVPEPAHDPDPAP
jgi:hypothetical protein